MKISNFWYKFFKYAPGVIGLMISFVETVFPAWGCPDNVITIINTTLGGIAAFITGLVILSGKSFWKDKKIVDNTEKGE